MLKGKRSASKCTDEFIYIWFTNARQAGANHLARLDLIHFANFDSMPLVLNRWLSNAGKN